MSFSSALSSGDTCHQNVAQRRLALDVSKRNAYGIECDLLISNTVPCASSKPTN